MKFEGWLVDETTDGNFLEYFIDADCVLQLATDCDIEVLEKLKKLLNDGKVKPHGMGKSA